MSWSVREPLLKNRAWLDYVRTAYSVPHHDYPYYTYIGLNFTAEGIKNLKFYFAYFRRLTEAEIDLLLPVPDRGRFNEFYADWHPSKEAETELHRGVTFALKVDLDGSLTHYYHLRVKGTPLGLPERAILSAREKNRFHGVCQEFKGGKAHLKRYYYLIEPNSIAYTLHLAGMSPRARHVELLEYIESDGRDKFTWVTKDARLVQELVEKRGSPELGALLAELATDTKGQPFAPGSARDGSDHAIYFFDPKHATGFDGVRGFVTKYLGIAL